MITGSTSELKGRNAEGAEALVRFSDVGHAFLHGGGQVQVLRGVDLEIRQGEVVSVLAPSGAGKSTLLKLMSGLLEPSSGQISWANGLMERRGLEATMVFQKPTLLPWQTVDENIELPFRLAGQSPDPEARQRAEHLLEIVHLQGFRSFYPAALSGGMQMRVALVRAFITRPRLVLMDEPFSALDEATRLELSLEMRRLVHEAGATVVFVTHSVQEAGLISDRVLVFSSRPARLMEAITSPLGSRRQAETLQHPEFLDFAHRLRVIAAHV